MAERKPAKASKGFTDEERAAMRERAPKSGRRPRAAARARRTGKATFSRRSPTCRNRIAP